MIYHFQWKGAHRALEKRLKDRQGYAAFKLLAFKIGKIDGHEITQASIEWHGDMSERPHPLFKEMIHVGGELWRWIEE